MLDNNQHTKPFEKRPYQIQGIQIYKLDPITGIIELITKHYKHTPSSLHQSGHNLIYHPYSAEIVSVTNTNTAEAVEFPSSPSIASSNVPADEEGEEAGSDLKAEEVEMKSIFYST